MPHYKRRAQNWPADIEPHAPVHSHVGSTSTACGRRNGHASAADLAPRQPRPGSEAALSLPSRVGDRLYWPDGRITDLEGKPCSS